MGNLIMLSAELYNAMVDEEDIKVLNCMAAAAYPDDPIGHASARVRGLFLVRGRRIVEAAERRAHLVLASSILDMTWPVTFPGSTP
jgi:hypothetical protein